MKAAWEAAMGLRDRRQSKGERRRASLDELARLRDRKDKDPVEVARTLRGMFEGSIQKTWTDYFNRECGHWVSSYSFLLMMHEQGIETEEAIEAMAEVVPEFFAGYWERLNQAGEA